MAQFTRSQTRIILAVGLVLYAVAMGALAVWLHMNADATTRRRLDKTPVVTAYLPGMEPVADEASVPSSWQQADAPSDAVSDVVDPQKTVTEAVPEALPKAVSEAMPAVTPDMVDAQVTEDVETVAPTGGNDVNQAVTTQSTPDAVSSARWRKYARPFDHADNRSRIAIVITDLGLSDTVTQTAIQELPADVSLSFSAAASDLEDWMTKARAVGHETIMAVPMEPVDYPHNDPGPNTLLVGLDDAENINRLRRAMSRAESYVAIMPFMGQKFVTSEQKLVPVLDTIYQQQVVIFDATLNSKSLIAPLSRLGGIPFTRADAVLDVSASALAMDTQLAAIEKIATEQGQAVVIASPYPVTLAALKSWIARLDTKTFVLAPITATLSEAP